MYFDIVLRLGRIVKILKKQWKNTVKLRVRSFDVTLKFDENSVQIDVISSSVIG